MPSWALLAPCRSRREMIDGGFLKEDEMISTGRSALRFRGSGEQLRLRVPPGPDALVTARQLCRGSVAVEKALGEALRQAVSDGHSWEEIGQALGVGGTTAIEVRERYEPSRHGMRSRLSGTEGEALR